MTEAENILAQGPQRLEWIRSGMLLIDTGEYMHFDDHTTAMQHILSVLLEAKESIVIHDPEGAQAFLKVDAAIQMLEKSLVES